MASEVTRLWKGMCEQVVHYHAKYPLFGRSYDFLMGIELENARNAIRENEENLKNLREKAYSIQHQIQNEEGRCRSISDMLRDLKKTDAMYREKVEQEIECIQTIETLQGELDQHKEFERTTFTALQSCITQYYQTDNEYKDRLRRISYAWSAVYIVFSVGIGTIVAWKIRQNFLNDLKNMNAPVSLAQPQLIHEGIQKDDVQQMMDNNKQDILSHIEQLIHSENNAVHEQLTAMHAAHESDNEQLSQQYSIILGTFVSSLFVHGIFWWMNSNK